MELRLDGLGVDVDGRTLVDDLDLSVARGEIVGLVGPNGSGKSTALRCVYRAIRPSRGVVRVEGDDVLALSMRQAAQRVAALTQEGGTDLDFTVAEVVALGRAPHQRGTAPLTATERGLCDAVMRQVDIDHLADRGILGLSGGERQRVLLARALVQQPEVLILDEPTNHLDIRHQLAVLGRLRGSGLTVLVVLHDLNLAAALCDRIAVLDAGRIVACGPPADTLTADVIGTVFGVTPTVITHPTTGTPQILFTLPDPEGPVP